MVDQRFIKCCAIFFALFTIISYTSFAQNVCGDNRIISTNPDNPINEREAPGPYLKLNSGLFDWRTQHWPIYSNSPYHLNMPEILSPYWDYDAEYHHIYKEFDSDDGWELIREKRGFLSQTGMGDQEDLRIPIIWVVMYNKYTGLLRVFISCKQTEDYTAAMVSLIFHDDDNNIRTNIIHNPTVPKPLIALDEYVSTDKVACMAAWQNNSERWLYADFLTVYDPCTCMYQSEIELNVIMILNAIVNLNGSIKGKIYDISDANQGLGLLDNTGKKSFDFSKLSEGATKAATTFKDLSSFSSEAQKSLNGQKKEEASSISGEDLEDYDDAAVEAFVDEYVDNEEEKWEIMAAMDIRIDDQKESNGSFVEKLADNNFLKNGLKAIPYIGAAVSVVDFFIGGGTKSEPQTVKLSPMAIEASITLTGTIETDFPYDNIIVNNPGCDNSNLLVGCTPIYDQVLGTFNLLKTPTIDYYYMRTVGLWQPGSMYQRDDLRYKFHDDELKYVINPAAGFKMQDVDIMASLFVQFDKAVYHLPCTQNLDNIMIQEDSVTYRTRFVPLECFNDVRALFISSNYGVDAGYDLVLPTVYLKLIVNLERTDRVDGVQNVIFVGKYPVKMNQVFYNPDLQEQWNLEWLSSFDDIPKEITLHDQTITQDYYAWDKITIGPNVTGSGNHRIVAGKKIETLPNAVYDPNLILELGTKCSAVKYGPVSNNDIISFCNSNAIGGYKPANREPQLKRSGMYESDKIHNIGINDLDIFPNPSSNSVKITYSLATESNVNMYITNSFGEKIDMLASNKILSSGKADLNYNVSNLPDGVYFLTLSSLGYTETKKFMVIH
jgi:hypothetical protein